MFVTLLSTDKRPVYPIYAKIEISGQGYIIKSKQGAEGGQYIELLKNQPVTLTGPALQSMLNPDKLNFVGISMESFINQGGQLPDGPVSICVTAYDAILDKAISNSSCAIGSIQLQSPPDILTPNGTQTPTTPQNLFLSWKAQHVGMFSVEYDIEIYEKNADFGYDIIVNSNAPVFTATTSMLNYQYTDLDPQLIVGKEYLMRVRVREITNSETFENDGWSEIEYFSYGPPGIAGCYQWQANFCAYQCGFTYGTLVCEKTNYAANIAYDGSAESFQSWLNTLGIGDFVVTEEVSMIDEFGYCETELIITASNLIDVPVSLNLYCSGFSDHCLPPEPGATQVPGLATEGGPPPNNIGNELSFDFILCPDETPESVCYPPADASLEVIAEQPVIAQLFWDEVPNQLTSGFEIEYHLLGTNDWILKDSIPADSLNAYIGEFEGGLIYEARVRAVCEAEFYSEWSAPIEFSTTCTTPNVVWVADKNDRSATLEWVALPYATTYEINYREAGTSDWFSKSTTGSFYNLIPLMPYTTYEYRLRVLCSEEWGGFTNVFEFTTDRICEGNTIGSELITNIIFSGAHLSWNDSAQNASDQYSIRYRPVGAPVWQVDFSSTAEYDFQFLESNTWYQFNISKHCTDIWSDWTNTGSFLTACAPPLSVWAGDITPESATMQCSADIAIEYEFSYRVRYTDTWIVKNVFDSYYGLSSLMDNTAYEFKVRVKCDQDSDWSEYTEESYFSTEIACKAPANYQIAELTPFSVRMQWEEAERPFKWGFYYRRSDGKPITGGPTGGNVSSVVTADGWVYQVCLEPELLIEGLTANKWYDFKIKSWCEGFGWTEASEISQFLTLADCKIPMDVSATFVGTDNASIAWTAQLEDQSYSIEIREKDTGSWSSYVVNEPAFNFDNLSANITYEYHVKTQCDNFGWTDWSETYEFRTDECVAPEQITKEYMESNSSIVISWQASAGENLYQLEYRLQDSLYQPEWVAMSTSNDYLEIADLQTDKIYEYRVAENCLSAGLIYNEAVDTFLLGRPSLNTDYFECGLDVTPFDPQNFYPLDYLLAGDSISAGDFGVFITEASGQIGNFTGRGYIQVPYFNKARVNVKFKNITVNDEYKLVNGKIKVTGIGFQVISQETADLLGDIVDALETLDDVLAQAEDILEVIDEIIETLGPYLPEEVVQGLLDAQAALATAQETGNEADISAAQQALQTANQNFQTAMTELLARVLNIIIESLNQLDQEYSSQSDQIIADYQSASDGIEQFEITHNGNYSTTNLEDSEITIAPEDIEWEIVDLTDQAAALAAESEPINTLVTLSEQYYEKVFAYGQMKGVQNLKAEVQTNADLVPFLAALNNKEINLLEYIGSQITDGKTDEEIIPGAKERILTGIDMILRKL
jgi:hypothetical protein